MAGGSELGLGRTHDVDYGWESGVDDLEYTRKRRTRTTRWSGTAITRPAPAALRINEIDTTATAWHAQAACRGVSTDLFFADDRESVEMALLICEDCPVQATCRASATAGDEHGVWGATTRRQRQ